MVNALPWPWLGARRARSVWAAGWFRSKRTAASEQAHVREVVPSFAPEVPSRVPAEALAHVTSRPEDTSLDPGAASAVMHLIAQDHTQNLAEAGDGWQALQGWRMGRRGRLDEAPLDSAEPLSIVVHQGEVDCDTLRHGGIRAPLRHTVPVRLVGQRLPDLGQIVWPGGLRPVAQAFGALTCQLSAAPAQVTGGPHRGGIDVGLWEPPATQQHSDVLGVDRVVFGLAAVDRLHRQRVPADNGQLFLGPEVGEPGPRSSGIRPRRPDPPDRVQGP
jgi:hypothetical protein